MKKRILMVFVTLLLTALTVQAVPADAKGLLIRKQGNSVEKIVSTR